MPISSTDPRERDIEAYLAAEVVTLGGKTYKWVQPGRRGANDRIVVIPSPSWPAMVHFVELKKSGGRTSRQQLAFHHELRMLGAEVYVLRSKKDVDEYVASCKWRMRRG